MGCVVLKKTRNKFKNRRSQHGLHPALIGLVIAMILGGLLLAGSQAGLFSFLTSGKDSNAKAVLTQILSSVESAWIKTGNMSYSPDWGYLARPSNSDPRPFNSDTIASGTDFSPVAQMRYAECELAKFLANNNPELTVGFLEIDGIDATSSILTTPTIQNRVGRWNGVAWGKRRTSFSFDGIAQSNFFDNPTIVNFIPVDINVSCAKGSSGTASSQYELGVAGSAIAIGDTAITTNPWVLDEPDDLALFVNSNIIWVDIHFGNISGRIQTLGLAGYIEQTIPPGVTIAIGNRSPSGNTFCIRRVFEGSYTGTYYQAISKIWTNTYEGGPPSTVDKDWTVLAFATCQAYPSPLSNSEDYAPNLILAEGGFPEPFTG